jgi:hypothetical protein
MTNDFDIFASPAMEVHTSELTASCMKAVELRLNGKVHAEAGEALFKGVVGHEALRRLHLGMELGNLAEWAIAQQKKEGTPCSESVKTNASEYEAEALRVCMLYWSRLGSKLKTLGCELPVRGTIEVDGEDVNFASHIDILARTPEGRDRKAGRPRRREESKRWPCSVSSVSTASAVAPWSAATCSTSGSDRSGSASSA